MSMLAETRRKQKWSFNPRGKYWSEDSNKFGQKMLEKMGWINGKGLGINEQGITEHVRISLKNDKTGIGYDKDSLDKQWTEQQEKFNEFLQHLQKYQVNEIDSKWETSNGSPSRQSLELKSKRSHARVHYQKFTRGKDVNKYSSKDLANILGQYTDHKKLINKTQINMEEDDNTNEEEFIDTRDDRNGIVTINSGSMVDYFKHKLLSNKKCLSSNMIENQAVDYESDTERIGFGFASNVTNTSSTYEIPKNAGEEALENNYAFDNFCFGLNSPIGTVTNNSRQSAKKKTKKFTLGNTSLCTDNTNIIKKLKTEIESTCKCSFTNQTLNLDKELSDDCNDKEFEVRRIQFGLENCGLDLTDEKYGKKRVIFNEHIEYNIDSAKKKKRKATLDKYEVENKKRTKKRKQKNATTVMSNGFINEALEMETSYEKINDNKLNKYNNEKTKMKIHKLSTLETIQESPEREMETTDVKTELEDIILDINHVEDKVVHNINKKLKKKKMQEKGYKIEDIVIDNTSKEADMEIEEASKSKKAKIQDSRCKTEIQEEIATSKKRKKKRKDTDCETELVKDVTTTKLCNDEESSTSKKLNLTQNDDSIKNKKKNTDQKVIKNTINVEILPDMVQEERIPPRNIARKKKKNGNDKDSSKNEIILLEIETQISDKENMGEEKNQNMEILSKKDKKRKKIKHNTVSDIESFINSSVEATNINISKKNIINGKFINIPLKKNKKIVNTVDSVTYSPSDKKTRISKKMLKILFYKNQTANFPGSNIHEIKGYGMEIDNNS